MSGDSVSAEELAGPRENASPAYYAKDGYVWKAPVQIDKPDGSTSISIGFRVCRMCEVVGDEAAETVAILMNGATSALAAKDAEIGRLRSALASDARVDAILEALLTPSSSPELGTRDHLPRRLRDLLSEECGRAGKTGFDDGYAEGYAKATTETNKRAETAEEELARLRDALIPFADVGSALPDDRIISEAHPEWERCMRRFKIRSGEMKVRDFRRARAALHPKEGRSDG